MDSNDFWTAEGKFSVAVCAEKSNLSRLFEAARLGGIYVPQNIVLRCRKSADVITKAAERGDATHARMLYVGGWYGYNSGILPRMCGITVWTLKDQRAVLQWMQVTNDDRRLGLGSKMLTEAKQEIRRIVGPQQTMTLEALADVDNVVAHSFMVNQGFEVTDNKVPVERKPHYLFRTKLRATSEETQ